MDIPDSGQRLKETLDASCADLWSAVYYMYRYPSIGVQQYICSRIRHHAPPVHLLPQLVHVFLHHNNTTVSQPVYSLFRRWASRSQRFACALYFHLKHILDSNDAKAVFCYFLICDLLEIDRRMQHRNIRTLSLQLRHRVRLGRTLGIPVHRDEHSLFSGIFLFFAKAVSWPVHPETFRRLEDYEHVFLRSRRPCSISAKAALGSGSAFRDTDMHAAVLFLEALVDISHRLRRLPKHLRQRGLEMEIRLLNHNLPARVSLPFGTNRFVLCARIEESFSLDSAENTPFLIVFETASAAAENIGGSDARGASLVQQQLNAIGGLSSLSEIDGVRENVLHSMEKILLTEICGNSQDDASAAKRDVFLVADRSRSADQIDCAGAIVHRHPSWMLRTAELRRTSPFRSSPGWAAESVIVKTGDSLKQEIIAFQLLTEMKEIWREEGTAVWVHAYQIYLVNSSAGLIETVADALSIHSIKKRMMAEGRGHSLKAYFAETFGVNAVWHRKALRNFLCSLVGYSLATYILQIKDRHNGNILIDTHGHIVHVDFGFILGLHPGFYCVEAAPFKFSKEYFDLLEDLDEFKVLFLQGFAALQKHSDRLCRILEMISENSDVECINMRELANLRDRLRPDLDARETEDHVLLLINRSFNSMTTGLYDSYQYFSNGYL